MRAIRTSIFSAAVLLCAAGFIWTSEAEMQATNFWTEAAESSLAEVALSNIALQRARSDAVKQFAQHMVTDHTQANQELARAAQAKGVTIPTALPEKRQRDVTDLNGLDAARFDRDYMRMMVKDHEKAVKLFERQAERGTDAEAKALASRLLPTLQSHLNMARSLYDTVRGGSGRDGNSSNGNASNGNSSNVNRSTNVRQDTNRNPNRNTNTNSNGNSNTNTNTNTNTNSNRRTNTNTNTNSTRRTNSNTGNSNNSNTMNHR